MGNQQPKDKLCLIPPTIKQRRRDILDRSEFDILGRAAGQLISDFFPNDDVEVNLFLKPNVQAENPPDIDTHSRIAASLSETPARVSGMVGVDVEIPNTGIHFHAFGSASGGQGAPTGYVAIEQRRNGIKWWLEGQPLVGGGRVGGGMSVSGQHFAVGGAYSETFTSSDSNNPRVNAGPSQTRPNVWGIIKIPYLMLGARVSDFTTKVPPVDFAMKISDPKPQVVDRPTFDVTLQSKNWAEEVSLSYYQHWAVRRKIYNPLEEQHITHIINYIDVGTKIAYNQPHNVTNIAVSGSWQLNKNHLIKAKVESTQMSFAYVFKNWFYPSFTLAMGSRYRYGSDAPKFGINFTLETSVGGGEFERAPENYETQLVKSQAEKAPEIKRYDRIESNRYDRIDVPAQQRK